MKQCIIRMAFGLDVPSSFMIYYKSQCCVGGSTGDPKAVNWRARKVRGWYPLVVATISELLK